RNPASERGSEHVCVLSSEDTESLKAHVNKRACEAEPTPGNSEDSTEEHCLILCMSWCLPTSISHSPTVFRRFCPLHSTVMIPWVLLQLLWISGHELRIVVPCAFLQRYFVVAFGRDKL
ncbi:Cullin-9, partial [Dissostichus eleginoides]